MEIKDFNTFKFLRAFYNISSKAPLQWCIIKTPKEGTSLRLGISIGDGKTYVESDKEVNVFLDNKGYVPSLNKPNPHANAPRFYKVDPRRVYCKHILQVPMNIYFKCQ